MRQKRINLIKNKIVGCYIDDLYRFVTQPENCTHISCGFDHRKDADGKLVKPKCVYISYRKLTQEELSHPDMKSLFIGMWIKYLDEEGDQRSDRVLFDMCNDYFVSISFQEGGNDRLVVDTRTSHNPREILSALTNYTEFVEAMKGSL